MKPLFIFRHKLDKLGLVYVLHLVTIPMFLERNMLVHLSFGDVSDVRLQGLLQKQFRQRLVLKLMKKRIQMELK